MTTMNVWESIVVCGLAALGLLTLACYVGWTWSAFWKWVRTCPDCHRHSQEGK